MLLNESNIFLTLINFEQFFLRSRFASSDLYLIPIRKVNSLKMLNELRVDFCNFHLIFYSLQTPYDL